VQSHVSPFVAVGLLLLEGRRTEVSMRKRVLFFLCFSLVGCSPEPAGPVRPGIPAGPVKPGITKENYRRIQKGMHIHAVKDILGPGGYNGVEGTKFGQYWVCWGSERPGDYVTIYFDANDLVCAMDNSKGW
jgi:hypothetical protein